jgi:phosphoglycerate dehydrogenase-like enzyme
VSGRFPVVVVDALSPRMRDLFVGHSGSLGLTLQHPESGDRSELLRLVAGAGALVTRDRFIDAELVDAAGSSLRLIQIQGRLPYRADLEAAEQAGVPVAVMPSGGAIAVAEHTLALMLALARKILAGHRGAASGAYRELGLTPKRTTETSIAFNWLGFDDVRELSGTTLGLVGLGEIGQEVARRARAFDMSVVYFRRRPLAERYERELGVRNVSFESLLREADWLSLHVPHTPETEGIVDARALALMKPTAFLVNTARGGLVDEEALVDGLTRRAIAGAGLDVYVEEPLPAEHPLARLDNVVLSPHLGGGAGGGHRRHVGEVLDNVARAARGEEPRNLVGAP